MKIKVGDRVRVIVGEDTKPNPKEGRVLTVDATTGKIVVEGVNQVYKHVRPSQKNPRGGQLSKEMPIDASNVMVLCPQTNEPTRIGYRYLADGSKERYAKSSGASMGMVSPPKKRYAKDSKA
jgi:large subunit ribosomal protein L24